MMKNALSYMLMAILLALAQAQQGYIQCRCMTHITNSVVQTVSRQLCGQKGGVLSDNGQLCTNLSRNFTDTDCRAFGNSFFATCATARSSIKRGIQKREITPIQSRPAGWHIGREPINLEIVFRRPIPDRLSKS
ncbi:hypothetical protein LZ32DRAFT_605933 [Colletotrichum eremochloae]|nr:hypothetical protein LZ32DRAFT_605933 [Colletotrichum eremochloae]